MARVGEWLSLVEHLVRDQGVGGSNPLSPTNLFNYLQSIFWCPALIAVGEIEAAKASEINKLNSCLYLLSTFVPDRVLIRSYQDDQPRRLGTLLFQPSAQDANGNTSTKL